MKFQTNNGWIENLTQCLTAIERMFPKFPKTSQVIEKRWHLLKHEVVGGSCFDFSLL